MAPTPTGFLHAAEGGPVHDGGAVLGLRGHQPHLLPISRTLALPRPRRHCANHRTVGLGNHVLLATGGQHPERLLVVRLQLLECPPGMFQRGYSYRTGSDLKSIMLLHALCRPAKGMLGAKVRQHPFQSPRSSSRSHSQSLRQRPNVTPG